MQLHGRTTLRFQARVKIMSKNDLIKRAFLNAVGVAAYIVLLMWLISYFGERLEAEPETWLMPVFVLLIFIISACVTASLVLLKPVLLFLEGAKKQAVHLFIYTLGFLAVLALVIGFLILKI